jgi:hypothetical protein
MLATRRLLVVVGVFLGACGSRDRSHVAITAPSEWQVALRDFTRLTPGLRAALDGDGALSDLNVTLVKDLDCTECYRLEGQARTYTIHAGDLRGAQYALAHLLEEASCSTRACARGSWLNRRAPRWPRSRR